MSLANLKRRLAENDNGGEKPLVVIEQRSFQVSVAELTEAIQSHPDHPSAKAFSKGIRNLPEGYRVTVDRADIEGLIENREVRTVTERNGEIETRRKELAEKTSQQTTPVQPKKSPEQESPQK